ncbi:MAG: 6-phosphogluconolactonase [Kineosporiaceae bacterium]|nr:6-phosphogluconolactonase [Kineosporiaceae bacterium]
MSAPVSVLVHRDADLLAHAVTARLVTRLVDVQSARGHAHLVLTGGGTGIACLSCLSRSPARDAIDWSALDIWWGDERFLPTGHPDRNATQARTALLDHVPIPPERVHEMPASDQVADVDAAASAYAETLRAHARPEDHAPTPSFDVLLLGMGPDGHVASLFPEHPALHASLDPDGEAGAVIGVRGSPKPPPSRVSLTPGAITAAREVWLVVTGEDKAPAVSLALSGAGPLAVPAAMARGRRRTLWLLDRAAAGSLPDDLVGPAGR